MKLKAMLLATGILSLGMVDSASADVVLGNQLWAGTATGLILSVAIPDGNQPENAPCVICGANQPQQPTGFGYNDYRNGGNQTEMTAFSDQGNGGRNTLADNTFVDNLTGGYQIGDGSLLKLYLLANGATNANLTFNIGIDVNDTNKPQQLLGFWLLDLTDKDIIASYTCTVSPGTTCNVGSQNNGTGKPDYTLSGFNLTGVNAGHEIIFVARMTGLNDGPDSFFIEPGVNAAVPEASTWAMMFLGFAGIGLFGMRKRRNERLLRLA